MYELPNVLDDLTVELGKTIKELSKTKDIDKKLKLAEIIKILSDSMGTFLDSIGMITPPFIDEFLDLEEEELFTEDIVDFNSLKNKKKRKKKKKLSDDDITFLATNK